MEDSEIYAKLTSIFRDVFGDDDIELTPETKAADIDGWDSLAHVRLVLTIERQFKRSFPASRIAQLKNVGDLVALVRSGG